ncbi:MAG: LptF/LptG family permease [Saprospiraceae bacterium]|nr:LptF/LptG family permease [Saprospiraceae bacterium]
MKKIDKLLLTSFIGPFAVSFFIALFVLIMQFLWLYIDDIAGKGVSIFIMLELIGYLSISTFPMALPIAVLIASVMVMGNLAERYELSSMKSAGVPLIRIMRSLIFCAAGIGLFSYVCSDFIIPISNLEFKSRLYDIRRQKPALTLEKGVFNEDFRQFVIKIGNKEADGETIGDVMIEDQTNIGQVKFNQILADSGQMYTTRDKRFFVMNLFEGTQYQEPGNQGPQVQRQKYPFIRTNFKSLTKVWDMREFEMVSTDKDRFSQQRSMLSMNQLRTNMDSLQIAMQSSRQAFADDMLANMKRQLVKPVPAIPPPPAYEQQKGKGKKKIIKPVVQKETQRPGRAKLPKQELTRPLTEYADFGQVFRKEDRPALLKEAAGRVKLSLNQLETRNNQIEARRKEFVKTGYELFTKYSFALVCFIFLFIGAPMGAIIRKGGFGYPILVSIIFFVVFIVLTIVCRKLAETYIMGPFWAAMVPCIILIPVGSFLTRKAMNDSQLFNTDRIDRIWQWLMDRLEQRKTKVA